MTLTPGFARLRLGEIDLARDAGLPFGDNAPIGSQYTDERNGMRWLKTGAGGNAWMNLVTRMPVVNVLDYGATGDGETDDRAAIQAAVDDNGSGFAYYFPAGHYRCELTGSGTAGIPVFRLQGSSQGNMLFFGDGYSSLIEMCSETLGGDRRLFDIRGGANNVCFSNLRFRADIANTDEQQHLLHWEALVTGGDTGFSTVEDCYFNYARGDALRFLGTETNRVRDIKISRCIAMMEDFSARTFVSFQRGTDRIHVDACYNQDVAAVDFEPTGNGGLVGNMLTRNQFVGILTLTGTDGDEKSRELQMHGNIVRAGNIGALDVEDSVISGNIIVHEETTTNATIALKKRCQRLTISDNILARGAIANTSAPVVSFENHGSIGQNWDVAIDGNLLVQEAQIPSGTSVLLRATRDVAVTRNLMLSNNSEADAANYITFETQADTDAVNGLFVGNLGKSLGERVSSGIAGGGDGIVCQDNYFRDVNNGILLDPTDNALGFAAANNVLSSASVGVLAHSGAAPVAIGGVGSPLGPTTYAVTTSPEEAVPAAIGSTAQRVSGGGASTTWYVKESDHGLATGWVGK